MQSSQGEMKLRSLTEVDPRHFETPQRDIDLLLRGGSSGREQQRVEVVAILVEDGRQVGVGLRRSARRKVNGGQLQPEVGITWIELARLEEVGKGPGGITELVVSKPELANHPGVTGID